ncbi:hypothetical protein LFL96_36700 (plasmid) [Paraburkholderia sp. D15]|uniref:hypothetical protein n=1 Tax=Paraburkholderia sp. D15 TaxID=2880218 RepID=UPI002478BD65|nr:hypothetical protein [Paraburkholderia sp. D15]WGS55018.1 hypothetical protein LFL96_36700 [Paraburkholderia sp. D15]
MGVVRTVVASVDTLRTAAAVLTNRLHRGAGDTDCLRRNLLRPVARFKEAARSALLDVETARRATFQRAYRRSLVPSSETSKEGPQRCRLPSQGAAPMPSDLRMRQPTRLPRKREEDRLAFSELSPSRLASSPIDGYPDGINL